MRNADPGPAGQVLAAVEAAAARGRPWSTAAIVAKETSLPHQAVEDALADLARRGALSRGLPGDGSPTRYRLTALGDALSWSLAELAGNGFDGRLKIDVSGDGRSNSGAYANQVRDEAVAAGLTINGLAILNEQPNVAWFYRTDVIGGPGAFVVSADDYRDFGEAIRRKLLRELAPGPVAAAAR